MSSGNARTKEVRRNALETLRSVDFFNHLKGALLRQGLKDEMKWAMGLYFVATSRFLPKPLNVFIEEATPVTAVRLLKKVREFLPPHSVVPIAPAKEVGWPYLMKHPQEKVVWIRSWAESYPKGKEAWVTVAPGSVCRMIPSVDEEGEDSYERKEIKGNFACVSRERPYGKGIERWLTIRTKASAGPSVYNRTPLHQDEFEAWWEVQRLIQCRALVPIVLPEWEEIAFETVCSDFRRCRHIPAVIQCWKTMCVIRSFLNETDESPPRKLLHAGFEDLAAAASLGRVFAEGFAFPSLKKVYQRISRESDSTGILNPLTGKSWTFRHEESIKPERWEPPGPLGW